MPMPRRVRTRGEEDHGRQIGFDDDPVALLNVDGFWTPLLEALDGLVTAGFVRREVLDDLVVADNLDDALTGRGARVSAALKSERPAQR